MKRHTNKHTKIFGLSVLALAMGVGIFTAAPTWAVSKSQEVDVEFTFNSVITLTVDQGTMKIESLTSGMSKDSNEIKLTVDTNYANGYYVAATAGKSNTNTNLTGSKGGTIAHLSENDTKATLNDMADNTWGVACVEGDVTLTGVPYSGFPKDDDKNGTVTGKHILDESSWNGVKTAKCKVGVKTSPVLPAGTYTNVVNFYAIGK